MVLYILVSCWRNRHFKYFYLFYRSLQSSALISFLKTVYYSSVLLITYILFIENNNRQCFNKNAVLSAAFSQRAIVIFM